MRASHPYLSETFIQKQKAHTIPEGLQKSQVWGMRDADTGGVVAFIAVAPPHIHGLFVHPDHQCKGHGAALVRFVRATHGPLTLEVFAQNIAARRLYARLGFQQTGQRTHDETAQELVELALDV